MNPDPDTCVGTRANGEPGRSELVAVAEHIAQ